MKNKKLIIIILSVIAIILVGIIVWLLCFKGDNSSVEVQDTGSFYSTTVTTNGYKIKIDSTESGHPVGDSIFSTSFKIVNSDKTRYYYSVEYVGIELYENGIPTVLHEGYVTINNKNFGYYLNEGNEKATLYYELPEKAGNLIIKVNGSTCFDEFGNTAKCLAPVSEKVLKSKELAGILNFEITKAK